MGALKQNDNMLDQVNTASVGEIKRVSLKMRSFFMFSLGEIDRIELKILKFDHFVGGIFL